MIYTDSNSGVWSLVSKHSPTASHSKVPEPSCRECRPSGTKSNSIKSDTVFTKSFISCKGLRFLINCPCMRMAKAKIGMEIDDNYASVYNCVGCCLETQHRFYWGLCLTPPRKSKAQSTFKENHGVYKKR